MYPEIVMMLASAAIASLATRVITRDVIAQPLRTLAGRIDTKRGLVFIPLADEDEDDGRRLDGRFSAADFVSCPRCVGWWLALGAFAAGYIVWPGHNWSAPQLVVWIAAAAATNIIYAATASAATAASDVVTATIKATKKVGHLSEAAEMRLHDHRRVRL